METVARLFSSSEFMPHGMCYLWTPGLIWLHAASDSLIALASYSIPLTLLLFVRRRQDLPFNWIFLLFGAFIIACGTTHAMEVWTLWNATASRRGSQPVSKARPAVTAGGHETILIAEDEEAIRTLAHRILATFGYHVLAASNGREAEKLVAESSEKIDVLLTDMVMPDMAGTELAARLVEKNPGLRVVFISGYTDDAVIREGHLESGRVFLQKPFTLDMLAKKIRDVLA